MYNYNSIILLVLATLQVSASQELEINKVDKDGNTLIHLAAQKKDTEEVKRIFKIPHCKSTKRNNDGDCFLHLAVKNDALDIVQIAVKRSAFNPHIINTTAYAPPIFYTVNQSCDKKKYPNHKAIFDALLDDEKTAGLIDVCFFTYDVDNNILLHHIFKNNHLDIFESLISRLLENEEFAEAFKESLEIPNYNGKSPQDYYQDQGSTIKKAYPSLKLQDLKKIFLARLESDQMNEIKELMKTVDSEIKSKMASYI